MSKKVNIFIQARMGSSRLPGKTLMKLGGRDLLEWVVLRCARSNRYSNLVVLTSEQTIDDAIAERTIALGCELFRGSEEDVLGRFISALALYPCDYLVRVCADSPFTDPLEIDRLIDTFFDCDCRLYGFNNRPQSDCDYADGFGAEIIDTRHLQLLDKLTLKDKSSAAREHVTSGFWSVLATSQILPLLAPEGLNFPELRFDVDTLADFQKIDYLVNHGVSLTSTAHDIVALYHRLRESDLSFRESA